MVAGWESEPAALRAWHDVAGFGENRGTERRSGPVELADFESIEPLRVLGEMAMSSHCHRIRGTAARKQQNGESFCSWAIQSGAAFARARALL
jgi:hypothetical protein